MATGGWMANLKQYFLSRVGASLKLSVDAARPGGAARRDYELVVRGIERDILLGTVSWTDFDRDGRRFGTRSDPLVARTSLRGIENASQALEDIVRVADPTYFVNRPVASRDTASAEADALERQIAALSTPEGRTSADEIAPTPGSAARLRAFWAATPNLVSPDIFSSKDGTIRARWNHGHDRTLWVNFPDKGPLGWSAAIPREGRTGLCKMNARCFDDEDILQCALLLGIRCVR